VPASAMDTTRLYLTPTALGLIHCSNIRVYKLQYSNIDQYRSSVVSGTRTIILPFGTYTWLLYSE
jgi:hypothetical protein